MNILLFITIVLIISIIILQMNMLYRWWNQSVLLAINFNADYMSKLHGKR